MSTIAHSLAARRSARALLVGLAALALALSAVGASAASSHARVLDSGLAPLPAPLVGQALFGVQAGGLPWRIDGGRAKLFADGHLVVEVEGLVLDAGPLAGTNPIPTGQAIVTCAGSVAAASDAVAFSGAGDAEVDQVVTLPGGCLAPAIFFAGITAGGPRWFAVTGF